MAYVSVANKGYDLSAGTIYTGITDTDADWGSVPNDSYFFDKSLQQVIYKSVSGYITLNYNESLSSLSTYNIASTQFSKTLSGNVPLATGSIANGCTFFDPITDQVANGTTSYSSIPIAYGIDLTLTGTSGTANIGIDTGSGIVNYLATFNTDLPTTAQDWIALHEATLKALGVNVLYNGGSTLNPVNNGNQTIRFCASQSACNSVQITTLTGDLNGTRINLFTGQNQAEPDHFLQPYVGQPYEGQRIHQTIRTNFNLVSGSVQYAELGLFRFTDDSLIGSTITIIRNPDTTGALSVIETYTAGASDPFVTGGFYPALINNTGQTLEFFGSAGILIQSIFQTPLSFAT